jgi:hypothetical protein
MARSASNQALINVGYGWQGQKLDRTPFPSLFNIHLFNGCILVSSVQWLAVMQQHEGGGGH